MEILAQNPTEKFLLLQSLESYLQKTGLSPAGASAFTLLATFAVLALLVWVLDRLGTKVLLGLIRHAVSKTETLWDDHLLRHKFFPRLIELATASGLLALVRTVFSGYGPALIGAITLVLRVYMTVVGALMIGALLNTVNDIYESKPQSRRKSIRGYIQTAKIVVWIIAGILIVSILIGRDPTDLLLGLGASAALVSLVFKDTILGFVASIQLSAQDMIRPGDWIEMPQNGINGTVTDISLTVIKVQNFDNTIVTVPPYSLVSGSFVNWRGMSDSGGRRIMREYALKLDCIKPCTPEFLERMKAFDEELAQFIAEKQRQAAEGKVANTENPDGLVNGTIETNLGLLRAYMALYLRRHPFVSRDLLLMVRTLPATENGLPVQIYCFSSDKNWPSYESIQAEIMEHFVAVLPAFELYAFQRTGARDVLLNGIAASGKADLATMETAPLHTDPSEKQGT